MPNTPTFHAARRESSDLPVHVDLSMDHSDEARVDSANLLRGQKSVTIVHNGAAYRLQATKLGKLILTK